MATLPQGEPEKATKLLQVKVTEEAYRRIKVRCALTDKAPGELISELAMQLPAAPIEDAA